VRAGPTGRWCTNRGENLIRCPDPSGSSRRIFHILGMNSRDHPKYKTKYRMSGWAKYDRGLVQRSDITLWISMDAADS
jgi:hypothetical protein